MNTKIDIVYLNIFPVIKVCDSGTVSMKEAYSICSSNPFSKTAA